MARDIIDFQLERERHETFLGREDVLRQLDALLWGGESARGWVLVKGGPGRGKSALLAGWLKQQEEEQGRKVPHHFLRRGVHDWDRPEVVARNLAAQVEALYPEQADPEAQPESRLPLLLQRVSKAVLVPRGERLVLLVDGLDEVEAGEEVRNPLQRFLPHALPSGVKVLCASRPMYPYLSWLEARENIRVLDLEGDERWATSNEEVVRRYWEHVAKQFEPPLEPAFVDEAVQRAQGNVLYTVKLAEWLRDQPVEKRRAELLPEGLEAFLKESWQRIEALPKHARDVAREGLGLIAVSREALPLSILPAIAGWKNPEAEKQFLHVARPFLMEEPGYRTREKAWRPFHQFFQEFLLKELGAEREKLKHRQLAEHLCQWPVKTSGDGFRRSYALRHGVTHWLQAQEWEQTRKLCTDLGYLEAKCEEVGALALEEDLRSAAAERGGAGQELLRALHRAIQLESHWLRTEPEALALLIYNRLRSSGWTAAQIEGALYFPQGLPALRLLHPVNAGGRELRTLKGHGDPVTGCAVTPDGSRVVSASWDQTLKVWDLETGRELATLAGHGAWVNGCVVTPDGKRVVSASSDQTLKVWDLEAGQELGTLKGHEAWVTGCAVTLDGKRVVSASWDQTLKVWDLKTGRELATLAGHGALVNGCAVTPDGKRVVSASSDRTLKVWDLETGRELVTLKGHKGWVNGCAVTPDGKRVVSASRDKTLKVWDLETGRELATLKGHKDWVDGCAVTPDGSRVMSASNDRTLKVWDLETGRELATLESHGGWVAGCAVTPDGKRVVSASWDQTLKVWDLETGRELATLESHGGWVAGCAVTPDEKRVVSASGDKTLKVWDLETGRELVTLKGHKSLVNGCAVTPDGKRVVSASGDKTLKVWDLETGRKLATLKGHKDWVHDCAVTPNGSRVVSASKDKTLKVWDLETGRELATLKGHTEWVTGCAVTPDGSRVVSASGDKTLKVWDLETGRKLATLEGHKAWVDGCAVTPDGKRMVSASNDQTLRVWDLEARQCHYTLYGSGAFRSVAVTPDVICAGDALGNIWILEQESQAVGASRVPSHVPAPEPTMSTDLPKLPRLLLETYRSNKLALFVGSGLSLGGDVGGNFPTWHQLPDRLLEACEKYDRLDAEAIVAKRKRFGSRMGLEDMLAELGTLSTALRRDYQAALNDIFRPANAAPGSAHRAVIQLGVRAILTTNYDQLFELVPETPRRQHYTWKQASSALGDLRAGRNVLLKVHGTAEHHDSVVLSELEYHKAHSDPSYQAVLSYLLQEHSFLFIGYGMNDPLDLDLALKANADVFKTSAQRHYVLLKDPADADIDRLEREYNVRVIGYREHSQLPAILANLVAAK